MIYPDKKHAFYNDEKSMLSTKDLENDKEVTKLILMSLDRLSCLVIDHKKRIDALEKNIEDLSKKACFLNSDSITK